MPAEDLTDVSLVHGPNGAAGHHQEPVMSEASHGEIRKDAAVVAEHQDVDNTADGNVHLGGAEALMKEGCSSSSTRPLSALWTHNRIHTFVRGTLILEKQPGLQFNQITFHQ